VERRGIVVHSRVTRRPVWVCEVRSFHDNEASYPNKQRVLFGDTVGCPSPPSRSGRSLRGKGCLIHSNFYYYYYSTCTSSLGKNLCELEPFECFHNRACLEWERDGQKRSADISPSMSGGSPIVSGHHKSTRNLWYATGPGHSSIIRPGPKGLLGQVEMASSIGWGYVKKATRLGGVDLTRVFEDWMNRVGT
jgi:hypothetical protein